MGFYDTKIAGPMVIEVPPAGDDGSLNGNFVTLWQAALEDAGLLGVDKGLGVKFVTTPPGYTARFRTGSSNCPLTPSPANLVRSRLEGHATTRMCRNRSLTGRRSSSIRCRRCGNPPATVFTDVKDATFASTIKYDLSFFTLLDRLVQTEPWIDRDRAMIDQLRWIGVEKGKPSGAPWGSFFSAHFKK